MVRATLTVTEVRDHVRKQGTVHHHEAKHRVVLCAYTLKPQNVRFISGGHHRAVRAHTRHFRAPPDLSPPTLALNFLRIIFPLGGDISPRLTVGIF